MGDGETLVLLITRLFVQRISIVRQVQHLLFLVLLENFQWLEPLLVLHAQWDTFVHSTMKKLIPCHVLQGTTWSQQEVLGLAI